MKIFWRLCMGLIPVCILFLVVTQFVISNELAGYDDQLAANEQQIINLTDENKLLYQQVAISRSLSLIENQAKILGFVKTNTYLQIEKDQPVALRK
jgi:hypothetical protein